MRTKTKVWLGAGFAGTLVVGFVIGVMLGVLAMVRQDRQRLVYHWIGEVQMLVRNARVTTPISPEMVVKLIGSGLNEDSRTLAQMYDHLTPYQRSSLAFYANAAQSIAMTQGGTGFLQDRTALRAFADCLRVAHGDERAFDECAGQRGLLPAAHTGKGAVPGRPVTVPQNHSQQ